MIQTRGPILFSLADMASVETNSRIYVKEKEKSHYIGFTDETLRKVTGKNKKAEKENIPVSIQFCRFCGSRMTRSEMK